MAAGPSGLAGGRPYRGASSGHDRRTDRFFCHGRQYGVLSSPGSQRWRRGASVRARRSRSRRTAARAHRNRGGARNRCHARTHDTLDLTAIAGLVCLASGWSCLASVHSTGSCHARLVEVLDHSGRLGLGAVRPVPDAECPVRNSNVPRPAVGTATPADRELDYVDAEFVTADGVTVSGWYLPSSNGAAVVLLHGASSTRTAVRNQAATLAEHGYGVLLYDARGHGRAADRYGPRLVRDLDIAAALPTWRAARRSILPDSVPSACQWAASR